MNTVFVIIRNSSLQNTFCVLLRYVFFTVINLASFQRREISPILFFIVKSLGFENYLKEVKATYEKLKSDLAERLTNEPKKPTLSESELLKLQQDLFARSRSTVGIQQKDTNNSSSISTTTTINSTSSIQNNNNNNNSTS